MPQNRPNARVQDSNCPIPAPRAPLHGPDVPPTTRVVAETRDAFLSLARVVLRHNTTLQQMGGDAGPSTGPSIGPPPPTGPQGPSPSAPPPTEP